MKALKQAEDIIRSGIAIPFTASRYCISESEYSKNIEITNYLAFFIDNKNFIELI